MCQRNISSGTVCRERYGGLDAVWIKVFGNTKEVSAKAAQARSLSNEWLENISAIGRRAMATGVDIDPSLYARGADGFVAFAKGSPSLQGMAVISPSSSTRIALFSSGWSPYLDRRRPMTPRLKTRGRFRSSISWIEPSKPTRNLDLRT